MAITVINWDLCQLHKVSIEALKGWVEEGIPPGDGLRTLLFGNAIQAYFALDTYNRSVMQDICEWINNNLPTGCYGSYQEEERWIERCAMLKHPSSKWRHL